jgi:predicted SprT family Zn-dependent metalloprotease
MPQPKVVFSRLPNATGLYYSPKHNVYLSNGISRDTGIIVVDPSKEPTVGSVIAHEWRHHYQHFHGPHTQGYDWNDLIANYSYHDSIIKYFISSPVEMDAYSFEVKHCKSPLNQSWLEWIVKALEREGK